MSGDCADPECWCCHPPTHWCDYPDEVPLGQRYTCETCGEEWEAVAPDPRAVARIPTLKVAWLRIKA